MVTLRPAAGRGRTRLDWLESRHSFSFGDYHDRAHMGYGALRVLNDDLVAPGAGFAPHRHANMEIVTIVLQGALAHQDTTGTGGTLQAGDVQRMSAGAGIGHSEYNASAREPVRFLQVWIQPDRLNTPPDYAQIGTRAADRAGRWCAVVDRHGAGGVLSIRQDARIALADLAPGAALALPGAHGRRLWLQLVEGDGRLGALDVADGDGVAISGEDGLELHASSALRAVLFDLA